MTKEEIIAMILEILAEVAPEEDLTHVGPDTELPDETGLDSMDFIDIVLELRKRYGIEVPEEAYSELTTLSKWAAFLGPKFEEIGK
jgi:acyl carrier protein